MRLRISNQDELRSFTLAGSSLRTCLVRLRDADGTAVFDNAIDGSAPDPDMGGLHERQGLAPGESMVLWVDAVPVRLPPGSYVAEWIYHDDVTLLRWRRFEDLVAFRGSCVVRVD